MSLATDYPALAQLAAQDPNYTALGVTQVRAIGADVVKALAEIQDVRAAVKRFRDAAPFGPGFIAGHERAVTELTPLLQACEDERDAVIAGARVLTAAVAGFDPGAYTAQDMIDLTAANTALAALLPPAGSLPAADVQVGPAPAPSPPPPEPDNPMRDRPL